MKRFYAILGVALGFCCMASAQSMMSTVTQTSEQDTLLFALPYELDDYMNIQNTVTGRKSLVMRFQPEYLITATDFTHGDTLKGTATLPNMAKVVMLSLDGYDNGTIEADPFVELVGWCRNTTETEIPNTDSDQGYHLNKANGQLLVDTVKNRNFHQNTAGYIFHFDTTADSLHPAQVVNLPFDYTFEYTGKNIVLTLWVSNFESEHMKYRYMTYESAETRKGSIFRSGNWCFSCDNKQFATAYGVDDIAETLKEYAVPAFNVHYYTNDVTVETTGDYTTMVLKNGDTEITPTESDSRYAAFLNLDYTATYELYIDGELVTTLTFDDITKDILVSVSMKSGISETMATRNVARVTYYDLTGAELTEPTGLAIEVTTYTDGSRSTRKVLR